MNIDKINVGGNEYDVCDAPVRAMVSDEFSEGENYTAGKICIHENKLCKFTADKAPGPWDASKVKETTLEEIYSEINSSMEALETDKLPITPVNYNTADQYRSGARAIYGEIRRDRGMAFGIEYQYDAGGNHFGAQMIISYADGILLRQLSENVWGEWKAIS